MDTTNELEEQDIARSTNDNWSEKSKDSKTVPTKNSMQREFNGELKPDDHIENKECNQNGNLGIKEAKDDRNISNSSETQRSRCKLSSL